MLQYRMTFLLERADYNSALSGEFTHSFTHNRVQVRLKKHMKQEQVLTFYSKVV